MWCYTSTSQYTVWKFSYSSIHRVSATDIKKWSHCCLPCQRAKLTRHTVTPLSSFPAADAPFDNIHMDFVCPLPPYNGYSYLLTCINKFTRWPTLSDITPPQLLALQSRNRLHDLEPCPSLLQTREPQFECSLWMQLMALYSYYIIPSPSQWASGMFPSPAQGCSQDSLTLKLGLISCLQGRFTTELVYGVSVHLPADFFSCSPLWIRVILADSSNNMGTLRSTTTWWTPNHNSFVSHPCICRARFSPQNLFKNPITGPLLLFLVQKNILSLIWIDTLSVASLKAAHLDDRRMTDNPSPIVAPSVSPASTSIPLPSICAWSGHCKFVRRHSGPSLEGSGSCCHYYYYYYCNITVINIIFFCIVCILRWDLMLIISVLVYRKIR